MRPRQQLLPLVVLSALGPKLKRTVLAFSTQEGWWKTALAQGAWLLVPLVGYVALLGWQRRAFEAWRAGDPKLPPAGLRGNLGAGWRTFLVILTLGLPPVLALAGADALHLRHAETWLSVPILAFVFPTYVELLRRTLVHGERAALFRPGPSLRAIRAAPGTFAVIVGCMFGVYVMIAGGIYSCFGWLLTVPVGHVVAAHLVGLWQAELDARQVP